MVAVQGLGAVRASVSPTVARLLVVVGFAIVGWVLAALFGSSAMAQESPSGQGPHGNRHSAEVQPSDVTDPGAPEVEAGDEPASVSDEVADRREQAVDELSTQDTHDIQDTDTTQAEVDREPVAEAKIRHSATPFAAVESQNLPEGTANAAVTAAPVPPAEPAEPVAPAPQRPLLGGILGTATSTLDSTLGSTPLGTTGLGSTLNATVAGLTGTVDSVTNTVQHVTSTLPGIAPGVTVPIPTPIPDLDALLPDLFGHEPLPDGIAETGPRPADRTGTDGTGSTDVTGGTKTPATTAPSSGRAQILPLITTVPFESYGNTPLAPPEPPAKGEATVAGGGGSGDGGTAPKPAAPAGLTSTSSGFVAAHDGAASGKSVHGVLSWAPTLTQLRFIAASRDHDTAGAGREAALPATSPD
ncbi:hypothetical protein SAMN05421630_103289 [Prauserella marina]|uniref:Uncharacterized protein n=1 Tax=Prauserella marina TaxID=530584 RepID=A0A1G6NSH1_9PSEU|nr:hypothetical protein DES30_102753 [Prauserella marina]SDC70863.1 hypothetical protein SAMN05421630_103289 [Prauserella marina]